MNEDEIWRTIQAERSALADILETLSPTEWEQASLCPGWTVTVSHPELTGAGLRQLTG